MKNASLPALFFLSLLLSILSSGCRAPRVSEEDVARVARDWCMTIRASQVIPTYPLTEDLLPGDVFLVRRPIQEEQQEYRNRGFLPLPEHVVRLHPVESDKFYRSSHGTKGKDAPPYFWRLGDDNSGTNHLLHLMPRAAFPSYSFSSRRGGGLNLAVPIQAIPVAMNFVGATAVQGTVLLKDAYTYGFDQANLQAHLQKWMSTNASYLKTLASGKNGTFYLRMISRVYLVSKVSVQVNSAASFAGSVSGGAEKQVNLPTLTGTNTLDHYTNALEKLSSSLSSALNAPGGTLKVASSSSRSVVMDETFPRPLVIGYLGFDMPILADGSLGVPQDLKGRLLGAKPVRSEVLKQVYMYGGDTNSTVLRGWLRENAQNPTTARAWLQTNGVPNLGNVLTSAELTSLRERMVNELIPKP